MDVVTLCNIFNFKCTKEVEENTKVKQLVTYINQNHLEYSELGEKVISKDSFLKFMENINSVSDAAKVLQEYRNLSSIGYEPEQVAKFFNVYSNNSRLYNCNNVLIINIFYLLFYIK